MSNASIDENERMKASLSLFFVRPRSFTRSSSGKESKCLRQILSHFPLNGLDLD